MKIKNAVSIIITVTIKIEHFNVSFESMPKSKSIT